MEVAVFADVADKLLSQESLARRQVKQLRRVSQVIGEVAGIDRDPLHELAFGKVSPGCADLEAIKKNVFPIGLFFGSGLFGFLLLVRCRRLRRILLLWLDQLQKWIGQQL